jgi:hypothetical protein
MLSSMRWGTSSNQGSNLSWRVDEGKEYIYIKELFESWTRLWVPLGPYIVDGKHMPGTAGSRSGPGPRVGACAFAGMEVCTGDGLDEIQVVDADLDNTDH